MDSEVKKIPLDAIDDPSIAMRSNVDDDNIQELINDMREVGLIEPIVVRPKGERYEVIAGHRRTRSARLLGWAHIEAKIVNASDDEAFTMRAIENLSRHDVNPVDEACYIGELIKNTQKTPEAISKLMNRSIAWVNQRLEVFEMPDFLQDHIRTKKVSLGAALELNKITNEQVKRHFANWAAVNGCTVSQAIRWVISANAEAENPNLNVEAIVTAPNAPAEATILVQCARCGERGPVPDMDYVPVHRNGCEPPKNQ